MSRGQTKLSWNNEYGEEMAAVLLPKGAEVLETNYKGVEWAPATGGAIQFAPWRYDLVQEVQK